MKGRRRRAGSGPRRGGQPGGQQGRGSAGDTGRGQAAQPGQGGGGQPGAARRNRKRRGRKPADLHAFWGDPAALPTPQLDVRMTESWAAVPRSLGPPPLPGHERISEQYFELVYQRAVTTAGALAAAGGLIDPAALLDEDR